MITRYREQEAQWTWYTITDKGITEDLEATDTIEWRIFLSETSYTQVELGLGWNDVDLVIDKLATGQYALDWTIPVDADIGRYFLEVKVTKSSVATTYKKEFEIITGFSPFIEENIHYNLIRDIRALGITDTAKTDWEVSEALLRAKNYIDDFCGREFAPVEQLVRITGSNSERGISYPDKTLDVLFDIVDVINEVSIVSTDTKTYTDYLHFRGTDYRNNPQISSAIAKDVYYFASGIWGYTEYDKSAEGKTPEEIRKVSIQLTQRFLYENMGTGALEGLIKSEKTATQSYTLQDAGDLSGVSKIIGGEIEIKNILDRYTRPLAWEIV